jgi:cardiolipin synthase
MKHLPNILTVLRLLLVPCFLWASVRGMYVTALVIFVSAAVTDIVDGMIARRLNVSSRLGALLDPAADKTLMVSGFLFYTFAAKLPVVEIPMWLTFAIFIRDFMIAIFAYLMYTRVQITRFPPTIAGKASTVLQAVTLGVVIGANAVAPRVAMLAAVLFRVSLFMTLFSAWGYMRRAAFLVRDERAAAHP